MVNNWSIVIYSKKKKNNKTKTSNIYLIRHFRSIYIKSKIKFKFNIECSINTVLDSAKFVQHVKGWNVICDIRFNRVSFTDKTTMGLTLMRKSFAYDNNIGMQRATLEGVEWRHKPRVSVMLADTRCSTTPEPHRWSTMRAYVDYVS